MAVKTVLPITPKMFTTVATGAGYAVATWVASHFDASWLSFLPKPEQAPAVALVGILIAGVAGWLRSESAGETASEQKVSDDIAQTVEDVIPVTITKTSA